MTKKDIESRIKFEANNIAVPDVKNRILAQVPNRKVVVKEDKKRFNFAVRFSYILTILIVVFISILLFTNSSGSTPSTTPTKKVGDVEKLYAKQIVTLAGFADTVDVSSGIQLQSAVFLSEQSQSDYNDIANKINEYFNAVSTLLSQDSAVYEIEESNDIRYSYKLTVKYKVLNDTIETVIYYNEKPDSKFDDEEDLDEIATDLDGKVEYNGKEYSFIGKKVIEKDEIEAEFTLEIDENNYLKVSHEDETGEKELKYEFFDFKPNPEDEKRKPYKEVNIKVDEEDKKVVINSREHEDEFEFDFTFNKEEDRDNVKVSYKHGDEKHENITIDDNEDDYRYDFTPDDDEDDYYFGDKPHGHGRPGDKEHHGPDHD